MKILALDLATKCGWAFWDGQRIESGVQDFTKQRGESNGMLFLKFNRWLTDVTMRGWLVDDRTRPDLIIFEQAHHRGGAATEIAVGLMTRILEFCALHKIEHTSVHSLTLKKWATGSGRSDKNAMVKAVLRYAPIQVNAGKIVLDDNEADAILIACYAREQFGGNEWNAQPAAAGATK